MAQHPGGLAASTFLEGYNGFRCKTTEGKPMQISQLSEFIKRSPRSPRGYPGSPRTARGLHSSRGGGDYAYMPLRSDVEDDPADKQPMPVLPHAVGGLKGRKETMTRGIKAQLQSDSMQGSLAWIESTWFQMLSGLVILANSIIIGVETDVESPHWFWIEQALLTFFVMELNFRLLRNGTMFFYKEDEWAWNLFDFSIVVSGMIDMWLTPLLFAHLKIKQSHMSGIVMLLRMCRLLRIVRLFRLVRIVRPLFELAMGIMEALQGMFWVLVFMVMTLYAAAILCTRLIGHGEIITDDDGPDMQKIKDMFGSVPKSMFTLFGTVSSWSLLKFVPLFKELPFLRPMFVLFYVYSAWALLAVMAGVVSKNMIAIRDQMLQEDKQKEDMRRANISEHLLELFRKADEDNSGQISREEFAELITMPDVMKKINKNTSMHHKDLTELFELIDHDKSGNITIDEFMSGFKWVNEPLRQKSLVRMQQRISTSLQAMETSIMKAVEQKADIVRNTVTAPLRKVYAITEQLQNLDSHLGEVWTVVKDHAEELPTPIQLDSIEDRLHWQLDEALDKLRSIDVDASG